jgi:DnaJ-class molecular chaperone
MQWREANRPYKSLIDDLRNKAPHDLLETTSDSTSGEIRSAYLAKIKAYHPDRADPFMREHFEEVVKLLNRAYEELGGGKG